MKDHPTIKEVRAVRRKISTEHGHDPARLEERAQRGKLVDIDRILAKVPAAEPLLGDE
jgi:hypothetical protein